jgi:hypothetical protein
MEYVPLYTPGDLSETAFIESLLMDNGVRYFIQNEILTRIYGQLGLTQRKIYVHPKDYLLARELLKDLLIDKPIPQKILDQIAKEDTAPVEISQEDREASRYRFFTISLLVAFAFYVLYKINSAG